MWCVVWCVVRFVGVNSVNAACKKMGVLVFGVGVCVVSCVVCCRCRWCFRISTQTSNPATTHCPPPVLFPHGVGVDLMKVNLLSTESQPVCSSDMLCPRQLGLVGWKDVDCHRPLNRGKFGVIDR